MTIEIQPVNDTPVARRDSYVIVVDTPASIPAVSGVLANDSDVDSAQLTASVVDDVRNGTLNLLPDGGFSYEPVAGFSGDDGFTYVASDGALESETVHVSIAVGSAGESIAITEIMCHPANENDAEEYVEIRNVGASPINFHRNGTNVSHISCPPAFLRTEQRPTRPAPLSTSAA